MGPNKPFGPLGRWHFATKATLLLRHWLLNKGAATDYRIQTN